MKIINSIVIFVIVAVIISLFFTGLEFVFKTAEQLRNESFNYCYGSGILAGMITVLYYNLADKEYK